MRFRAYFAAKVAAAGALLWSLLGLINGIWPADPHPAQLAPLRDGNQILTYDLLIFAWFLLCSGALALIILDQRRRCRTCLRRLRMPVGTGSWGQILLLGRPRTEYICPFASSVGNGNTFGVQFHPEKSGATGLRLLRNFISLV